MGPPQKKGVCSKLVEELYTCCAFWVAMSALPALAISYVVVRVSKHLWIKVMSSRYPGLEFIRTDTVRSLLDTHRNQGIINVLLGVNGAPDPDRIREQLRQHVIDRKDKSGELMFPRLRHNLVSCWGNYAWDASGQFRPENHFLVANAVYRGRPVSDNNIQDYVSEIVSKYFPGEQPPWQYIVIPVVSIEPKYYILVRVHHLLLTGRKSITIGDLLMVEQLKPAEAMTSQTDYSQQSPLAKLFPTPSALPELWGKLNENLSNAWNEFISEYDPVESPRALKTLPGAFHVAGLVLISAASALRELTKRRSNGSRSDAPVTAATLLITIQQECKRRNLTIPKILISPLVTADPRKWPRRAFRAAVTTIRTTFKLPLQIRDELRAVRQLATKGQVSYPNTFTWKYGELAQLLVRASGEVWRGMLEAYKAPRKLWTDTVAADDGRRHLLQTVNLCGRKVAAWSRPVPRANIERAARALGVSATDIAIYGATEALRAFFEQAQAQTPESVLTTARAASEDFLFTFAEGHGKSYKKYMTGGMICLSLPIGGSPRRIASVVEQACERQSALAGAWAAQARYGALTRAVPSPFAKLTLNLLSRRYAVSYAEINAPINAKQRTTLWGQSVDCVIYWRPPQANISMSLTVIQYAATVRLAVMTDARLSPAHTVPAIRWPGAIDQLVTKVDQQIARIAWQTQRDTPEIAQIPQTPEIAQIPQTPQIPQIITPEEEATEVDSSREVTSSGMLKPPPTAIVSPPPMRRTKTHH